MSNELQEYHGSVARFQSPPADIILLAQKLPARNYENIQKEIVSAATSSTEVAKSCVYVRPVGKKKGKQTYVLGPSVRLAEIAHGAFGHIWCNGFSDETSKSVVAQAMAFDLKKCNICTAEETKSIMKRPYGNEAPKRYSDAQVAVTKNAALSIARRNAILQICRAQVDACMNDIKQKIITGFIEGKDKQAWELLKQEYDQFGVTEQQLIDLVESNSSLNSQNDKIILLIGVLNSIKDGVAKPSDIFGYMPEQKTETKQPQQKPVETPKKEEKPKSTRGRTKQKKQEEKPAPAPEKKPEEAPAPEQPKVMAEVEFAEKLEEFVEFAKANIAGAEGFTSIDDLNDSIAGIQGIDADSWKNVPADKYQTVLDEFNKLRK